MELDKESRYLLQKLDCNCSDCKFMERDLPKFQQSLEDHHRWQLNYFNVLKNNLLKKADEYKDNAKKFPQKSEKWLRKANGCIEEAGKMKFQFNKGECLINYGNCTKFDKPVSFLPNTCQIDTQDCFQHRKDI